MGLGVFFAEDVKTLADDALEFELGRADELSESKVFGSNLIDTKCFLTVDVAGDDGLDKVRGIDVHGEHAFVLGRHDHVALATLDAAVGVVGLALAEGADVAAVGREFVDAGHDPAKNFVNIVAFGDGANLGGVGADEGACLAAYEGIAVDDAYVVVCSLELTVDDALNGLAHGDTGILRSFNLATCYGDDAAEVHLTGAEQTAEEEYFFGTEGPNDFALVYGVDVVDLYADEAGGIRTFEETYLCILDRKQGSVDLFGRNAYVHLGDAGKPLDAETEIVLLTLHYDVEVGSERHLAECADEDGLGSHLGRGNHVVGALAEECEDTSFEQELLGVFGADAFSVGHLEALLHLSAVGLDVDGEELATLSALNGGDGTAHRRYELDGFSRFVNEKRCTCQHLLTFLDLDFGHDAAEIVGHEGILAGGIYITDVGRSFALQTDVESFFDFVDFHYVVIGFDFPRKDTNYLPKGKIKLALFCSRASILLKNTRQRHLGIIFSVCFFKNAPSSAVAIASPEGKVLRRLSCMVAKNFVPLRPNFINTSLLVMLQSSSLVSLRLIAVLLLLLSATGESRAQQSGGMADSVPNSHAAVVPREPRGVVGVSVGVNGGYVLPHNKVVANLLTGSRYVTIAHACATWRADAARAAEDDNMYGIPRFESGLLISDFSLVPLHRQEGSTLIPSASPLFSTASTMGQMITPYGAMERPLVRGGRVEVGYRMEQGIGIETTPYNPVKNPENEMIGGRFSILVGLGFYADVKASAHWTLGAQASFHHYSNGRTSEPNIGVNPLDVGLRAVYTFRADTVWSRPFAWMKMRREGRVEYRKHFYGDFSASWLPRVVIPEWNYCWYHLSPDDPRYRTGTFRRHHCASFNAALMYSYSPKFASGIGLEYMYAPIADDIFYWETLQGRPNIRLQSPHGLSVVAHHETRYKNLAAHVGLGYYIFHDPFYADDTRTPIFETAGVRYYLPVVDRRLYIGYNIRAHAVTADAFQFSVGYAFGR